MLRFLFTKSSSFDFWCWSLSVSCDPFSPFCSYYAIKRQLSLSIENQVRSIEDSEYSVALKISHRLSFSLKLSLHPFPSSIFFFVFVLFCPFILFSIPFLFALSTSACTRVYPDLTSHQSHHYYQTFSFDTSEIIQARSTQIDYSNNYRIAYDVRQRSKVNGSVQVDITEHEHQNIKKNLIHHRSAPILFCSDSFILLLFGQRSSFGFSI